MKKHVLLVVASIVPFWAGCDTLQGLTKTGTDPTSSEMTGGLRQALEVGTNHAVAILSAEDGYLKDPRVKIPFPPEAIKVANTLRDLGAGGLVDDLIEKMNRGAEAAAKEAAPIFVDAIKAMTITDAKNILTGADDSATKYFEAKTRAQLYDKFYPHIETAMSDVGAARLWSEVTTRYNQVPFVQPVSTDIVDYATNKGLDGLFVKVAEEEKRIRADPLARGTDLLKKVFGWAQSQSPPARAG